MSVRARGGARSRGRVAAALALCTLSLCTLSLGTLWVGTPAPAHAADGSPLFSIDNRGPDLFVELVYAGEIGPGFVFTIDLQVIDWNPSTLRWGTTRGCSFGGRKSTSGSTGTLLFSKAWCRTSGRGGWFRGSSGRR